MRWFSSCALALGCCLAAGQAPASSSGTASLGPLTVTLVDLDLGDGIIPSVTFAPAYGQVSRAYAWALDPFGATGYDEHGSPDAWADASAGVALALSRATASVSGAAPSGSGAQLIAQGSYDDFDAAAGQYAQYAATAAGPYIADGSFTLSAATRLTISGWGSVAAQASSGYPSHGDFANANVILDLQGPGSDPSQAFLFGNCFSTTGEGPCTANDADILTVSFSNTTTGSVSGSVRAVAYASGYSYANTVPEAGSWALLLSGLPLLLLSRRCQPFKRHFTSTVRGLTGGSEPMSQS